MDEAGLFSVIDLEQTLRKPHVQPKATAEWMTISTTGTAQCCVSFGVVSVQLIFRRA